MICIDDLNDWTGFLGGHPDVQTPHMDKLAKSGTSFANAHCIVPVCSCSRISVMSGLAATTHGSYEIGPPYQGIPLLKDFPTIHRYFKNNGYTTLSGGKVLHHGFSGSLSGDLDQVVGKGPWPNPRTRPKKPLGRPAAWSKYRDWGPYPETNDTAPDYQIADPVTPRKQPTIISSYQGNHAIRSRDWRLISYAEGTEGLDHHKLDQDGFKNLAKDPKYQSVRDELALWLPKEGAPEVRTESKYEHLRGPEKK